MSCTSRAADMITAADQKAWARHYRRGWWAGVQRRDKQLDGLDEWRGTAYLTGYSAGEEAWQKADEESKLAARCARVST